MDEGVLLACKTQIKQSAVLDLDEGEPDFMVFRRRNGVQTCHVVELKDGHVFDTKKARAEWDTMTAFIQRNACHITCPIQPHFCAFNQKDRKAIRDGFKHRIPLESILTGREFCDLLEIDYDPIVAGRQEDCADNVEYLLSALLRIKPARQRIVEMLGQDGL